MPAVGGLPCFGLPPAGRDQRGRLHDHGADRSAVPGPSGLWLAADGGWLATQGHLVNRKRIQRLMRLAGLVAIYQQPNTSKPAAAHKIYPYLLGGISIERVNQVWCSDVTYIPMAKGFL
jgi:HTH-like domain